MPVCVPFPGVCLPTSLSYCYWCMLCLLSTRIHFSLNWPTTAASCCPVQFFKGLSTVSESVRGALLAVSLGILESLCNSCWGWTRNTWKRHLIRVCVKMPIHGTTLMAHSAYLSISLKWLNLYATLWLVHLNLCVCLSGVDVCWWWWDIPLASCGCQSLKSCQNLALDVRYLFGRFYLCEVSKWTMVSFSLSSVFICICIPFWRYQWINQITTNLRKRTFFCKQWTFNCISKWDRCLHISHTFNCTPKAWLIAFH